jgi:hypothetical protein
VHARGPHSARSLLSLAQGTRPACEESVTKLMSSAKADSILPTFAFPALKRWANVYRRSAADADFVPPPCRTNDFVTDSENAGLRDGIRSLK